MRVALGIDLGSTSVTVVVVNLDDDRAELLTSASNPNHAEMTSASDRVIGRSEWDIEAMVSIVALTTSELKTKLDSCEVVAIGITGQQQGCQLLDIEGKPIGPFIAWQDQRCKDRMPNSDGDFLDAMAEKGGAFRRGRGLPAFPHAGCPIVTGYTAPTLFWLDYMDMMPSDAPLLLPRLSSSLIDSSVLLAQ